MTLLCQVPKSVNFYVGAGPQFASTAYPTTPCRQIVVDFRHLLGYSAVTEREGERSRGPPGWVRLSVVELLFLMPPAVPPETPWSQDTAATAARWPE